MTANTRLSPSGPFIAPDALSADGIELSIGAVADGQVLKRVGDEIVGVAPSGVSLVDRGVQGELDAAPPGTSLYYWAFDGTAGGGYFIADPGGQPSAFVQDGGFQTRTAPADGLVLSRSQGTLQFFPIVTPTLILDVAGSVVGPSPTPFVPLSGAPAFGTHLISAQGVVSINGTGLFTAQLRDPGGLPLGQPIEEQIDPASSAEVRSFSVGPFAITGDPNGCDLSLSDASGTAIVTRLALTCVSFP